MNAAEQGLGKVKQCVSRSGVAKFNQASESQAPVPVLLDQHVSLLQIVMAKDSSRAVPQKIEARPRFFFQAARQGLITNLLAELPECLAKRRAHVVFVGRLGPKYAVGDDVTVRAHGDGVQTPQ